MERIHIASLSVVDHTVSMSFAGQSISIVSTVSTHTHCVRLLSLLYEVIILRIEPSWLVHVSSRWVSWLCFLVGSWDLFTCIDTIHIFSNDLIFTGQRLLLSLLLRCQSSTSASHVCTILLSIIALLASNVSIECVLMRATNTHLTLTQMLRILIK